MDDKNKSLKFVNHIDNLNEEVKTLALNMAIYLAKIKNHSSEIHQLEPEFIKLVNGTVKVVQEVSKIINAAQHREKMIFEVPSGKFAADQVEVKLYSILEQCQSILNSLTRKTDLSI